MAGKERADTAADAGRLAVPALTALYVDFLEPDCHRVWRWLSLLPERETMQVRPFLVDTGPGDPRPWDRDTPSAGLELLAMAELARDAGHEAHLTFVDAVFDAVHGTGLDLGRPEAWLAFATDAGLDLDAFTRDGDRWRAEVGLWHAEAEDDLGVRSAPTLVFDDEDAVLVRLGAEVDGAVAARRLLDALTALDELSVTEVRARG